MAANYIPEGYNAVIPALAIKGAAKAMEWYKEVFGAKEKLVLTNPDKSLAHGEMTIDGCVIMVSEENLQYNKSPQTLKGNSVNLCLYVKDVDAVIRKAEEKGAKLLIKPADQFYGARSGRIEDPFGYIWIISTAIKEVSQQEMQKMLDEWSQQNEGGN